MSNAAVAWAWNLPMTNQTEKLVLLAIANNCGPDNEGATSIESMAATACVGAPEVREAIRSLAGAGLIHVILERGMPRRYRMPLVGMTYPGMKE